jgi:hypothetical protein
VCLPEDINALANLYGEKRRLPPAAAVSDIRCSVEGELSNSGDTKEEAESY